MKQHTANVATVSIAFIALAFSIWQGVIQRTHNHVSLEPRINAYYSNDGKTEQEGLYIINNGMGPAFVEAFEVSAAGHSVPNADEFKLGTATAAMGLDTNCLTIRGPRANDSFKAGEEMALIEVSKGAPKECVLTAYMMRAMLAEGLDFTLTVKSIYGDRFEYNLKKNVQRPLCSFRFFDFCF